MIKNFEELRQKALNRNNGGAVRVVSVANAPTGSTARSRQERLIASFRFMMPPPYKIRKRIRLITAADAAKMMPNHFISCSRLTGRSPTSLPVCPFRAKR